MKNNILTIIFILLTSGTKANDGSFYAQGNTLFPLQETTIQLKKEILNLTKKGAWMQVDVYFEFYNPGPEKELLVGFVTPPEAGDIANHNATHPQITGFSVVLNNDTVEYKITKMKSSGFKIADSVIGDADFVYHFSMRFPKGKTIIRHSYQYRGGDGILAKNDYFYRLTTGTSWANREIEDFELNINTGDDCYFSLPYSFNNKPANWKIKGTGRLSKAEKMKVVDWDNNYVRMAYVRSGEVQFKAQHFKPVNDLWICVFTRDYEVPLWTENINENDFIFLQKIFWRSKDLKKECAKLTDKQLRLLLNLPYARAGYDFKDRELKKAFSKYIWYMPDASVMPEFKEYYYDKEVFAMLADEVKKRKEKTR